MAVADVWEVTISARYNGQRVANVIHFIEETLIVGSPAAELIADVFEAEFMTDWLACVVTAYVMDCIYVRRVQPIPSLPFLRSYAGENAGTIAGDGIPGNASAIISFKTEFANKSGRGRLYLCGISEADQAFGILDAGVLALLTTLAEDFEDVSHTVVGGGTIRSGVYSRALGVANSVIVADPSPSIASMRSRRAPFGMIP